MHILLNWLWQGGMVALAAALALHLLRGVSGASRYAVCWIALLVILALPFVPAAVNGSPEALDPIAEAVLVLPDPGGWPADRVLLALWAAWIAVAGWSMIRAVAGVHRARAACASVAGPAEQALVHWQRVRRSGRPTRLVRSERVHRAAVLGFGNPVVAVAPSLLEHLRADDLDRIVLHEWAHVQRRDDVGLLLQMAVRTVAGWHPAVWWIMRRLHVEREVACDETAIAITGSRQAYAACLAKLAARGLGARERLAGPAAASAVMIRIDRILSGHRTRSAMWSRAGASVAAAALTGVGGLAGTVPLFAAAIAPAGAYAASVEAVAVRKAPVPAGPAGSGDLAPARLAGGAALQPSAPRSRPAPMAAGERAPHEIAVAPLQPARRAPRLGYDLPGLQAPDRSGLSGSGRGLRIGSAEQPAGVDTDAASRWSTAAQAGIAAGRGSQKAARATAGFFNRLGSRVADSF